MTAALDVTKQRDLGGFYRHMYNQTFAEKTDETDKVNTKEVPASFRKDVVDSNIKNRRQYRQRREDSPEPVAPEPIKTEPVEDVEQEVEENDENQSPQKHETRETASASLVSAAAIDRAAAVQRAEKAAALQRAEKAAEKVHFNSFNSSFLFKFIHLNYDTDLSFIRRSSQLILRPMKVKRRRRTSKKLLLCPKLKLTFGRSVRLVSCSMKRSSDTN